MSGLSRRGLIGAIICAPAIVRASSLMRVKVWQEPYYLTHLSINDLVMEGDGFHVNVAGHYDWVTVFRENMQKIVENVENTGSFTISVDDRTLLVMK